MQDNAWISTFMYKQEKKLFKKNEFSILLKIHSLKLIKENFTSRKIIKLDVET